MFGEVINELGCNVGPGDISACHRLGRGRNARVIVRFVNRQIVDFCLTNRRRLSELRGVLRMNLRFYESLCTKNEEVLKQCKTLQENGQIKSYFIRNGFVKIVVNEGDDPLRICHPQELRSKFSIPEG